MMSILLVICAFMTALTALSVLKHAMLNGTTIISLLLNVFIYTLPLLTAAWATLKYAGLL